MEWSNTPQLAVGYFNVCVYKKGQFTADMRTQRRRTVTVIR